MMINKRLVIVSTIFVLLAVVEVWAILAKPKIVVNSPVLSEIEDKPVIASSNSYDVSVTMTKDETSEPKAEDTPELKLELIGTAICSIKDPIAFIKDLETGGQRTYKLGNRIKEAKIIRIAKGIVEFDCNGIKQTLRLRTAGSSVVDASSPLIISADGDRVVMNRNALLAEAGNILETAKKIKVKPYGDAKVIGLQVEGITRDSVIAQVGIRDKDIVTAVNNQKIDSYQKALQVFNKVRNQAEIKVSLLRNGEAKQLSYRLEN